MEFFEMVSERILEYCPDDIKETSIQKISNLKELQKAKYRKGVLNDKIIPTIVKAENDLWNDIKEYQYSLVKDVKINGVLYKKEKFLGFTSPWEYLGIEKKLFNFINNNEDSLKELNIKFPCEKCWNDPEEVTSFHLSSYDDETDKLRIDWFRGVAKQRKHFKNGIYIYHCSTCGKWGISSKKYNPHS